MDGDTLGYTAASTTIAAAASVVQLAEDSIQQAVDAWLDKSGTIATNLLHVTATLAGGAVVATSNPLIRNGGEWPQLYKWKSSASSLSSDAKTAESISFAFTMFLQPNIEGIPIFVSREKGGRDVEVSQEPLIQQSLKGATTFVSDNAVPRLATFELSGHLMSASPWDNGLIIKPTLQLQRDMLERYTKSRRPVMYKTFDNRFIRVLITHFDWEWVDKEMNAITVNIRMIEYKPLEVNSGLTYQLVAKYTGAA